MTHVRPPIRTNRLMFAAPRYRALLLAGLLPLVLGSIQTLQAEPAVPPIGERAYVDRPDDHRGLQVHLVYCVPPDGPDEHWDLNGAIADSIRGVNAWFAEQTGGKQVRVDTWQGQPDITFYRLKEPLPAAGDSISCRRHVDRELRAAGLDHPDKINLVYYGGERPGNWAGTGWKSIALVMYRAGKDRPGAGPFLRGLEATVAHEILHVLGAVPDRAPNEAYRLAPRATRTDHLRGHIGNDPDDIMYKGPQRRREPPFLDPGRDDYYGHGRRDLLDVARSPIWLQPGPEAAGGARS